MRLIHPGNGSKPITATNWYMLELRSEKTGEETIKRIGKALKRFFQDEEAEIFVPIKERNLDTFTLLTECYIFVRANDIGKIAKLRTVTGVQGVVSREDSLHPSKFIPVEDAYVQDLIKQCWDAHHKRAAAIHVNSWVRLLDGQTRNYCGLVLAIHGSRAMIRIDLKTKVLTVDTSLHNLLDLSYVPDAHRVFYYSEPVQRFLKEHRVKAEAQLKGDLAFDPDALKEFLANTVEDEDPRPQSVVTSLRHHTSREQTPTRFVESLMLGGERDVKTLLAKTVSAIRSGTIHRPKTAMILWHVIRTVVVRVLKPLPAPGKATATYTQVKALYGDSYELSPTMVHEAIPELAFRDSLEVTEVDVAAALTPTEPGSRMPADKVAPLFRAALQLGAWELRTVVAELEHRLLLGTIRSPKNLDSIGNIIRNQVLRHFRPLHPDQDVRGLASIYHNDLRMNITMLKELFPNLEKIVLLRREAQTAKREIPSTYTEVKVTMPVLAPKKDRQRLIVRPLETVTI